MLACIYKLHEPSALKPSTLYPCPVPLQARSLLKPSMLNPEAHEPSQALNHDAGACQNHGDNLQTASSH